MEVGGGGRHCSRSWPFLLCSIVTQLHNVEGLLEIYHVSTSAPGRENGNVKWRLCRGRGENVKP